ncbi:MAG TPA: MFS transporter [Opitutaceae bacterium]|nr:MFS transporter [Opitutaceae bacterium]
MWILYFGTFLNKFGSFVIPFLAIYLTSRGFTPVDAGIAIGAYGLGNVGATILGGYMADHVGRRKTIVLSMFSGATSMILLSQATSFPLILALSALAGLASEFYRPASSALLADLVPASNRVTAYSAYRMFINAGFAFGPATAGFIAGHGFFWLFAGDAGTSVLFGIVAIFALPEGSHASADKVGWKQAVGAIAADRRLHRMLLAALGCALIFSQMTATFGLAVTHAGFSTKIYGALLSLNGVLVVVFELGLTRVTRHFRPMAVISFGYLLAAVGFSLAAFAHSIAGFAACVTVFTFGEMTAMPVASAYVAGLSPDNMRGRYMGAYGLTWTLSQVVGPALGMSLFGVNPPLFWLASAVIGLSSAVIAFEGRGPPLPVLAENEA